MGLVLIIYPYQQAYYIISAGVLIIDSGLQVDSGPAGGGELVRNIYINPVLL